jgi:hypothetical protein
MGMDVCGKKPGAPEGAYFRATVWWWWPLADYVCEVAPEITHKCQHWHSNDGDGQKFVTFLRASGGFEIW